MSVLIMSSNSAGRSYCSVCHMTNLTMWDHCVGYFVRPSSRKSCCQVLDSHKACDRNVHFVILKNNSSMVTFLAMINSMVRVNSLLLVGNHGFLWMYRLLVDPCNKGVRSRLPG